MSFKDLKFNIREKIIGSDEWRKRKAEEEQQRYKEKIKPIIKEIIELFREKQLSIVDVQNILTIIQQTLSTEIGKLNVNYLINTTATNKETKKDGEKKEG